jgi:DNA modification methylase
MPKNSTKIWKLGEHRLMLGDSTDTDNVQLLFEKEKATLVLTDPPYGVGYVEGKQEFLEKIHKDNGNQKFSAIKGDEVEQDYYDFSKKWLEPVKPHLTDKNAFYIFNSDMKLRELLNSLHDSGYSKSSLLIWLKNNHIVGRKDFHPQHELIV